MMAIFTKPSKTTVALSTLGLIGAGYVLAKKYATQSEKVADEHPSEKSTQTVEASSSCSESELQQVIVWIDGCWDGVHHGHDELVRKAKGVGLDHAKAIEEKEGRNVPVKVWVGVHSAEEITKNKGVTLWGDEDRYAAVRSNPMVDRVFEAAPYVTSGAMMKELGVTFVVHGDDAVAASDGTDCYGECRRMGIFRTVPRHQGVSTTSLTNFLLKTISEHPDWDDDKVAQVALEYHSAEVQRSFRCPINTALVEKVRRNMNDLAAKVKDRPE